MSTRGTDTHEEPWLREALDSLLADEPAMAPTAIVEDVRRGQVARAVVRRRRTAALAVAGLALAVGAPSALLLRAAGSAAVVPGGAATGSPTAGGTPTAVASPRPSTVTELFVAAGWEVQNSTTGVAPPGVGSHQVMYELRGPGGAATVLVTEYAPGQADSTVIATCTASTCEPAYVGTSRVGPGGFRDDGRLVTDAPGLPPGSLVVDRVYDTGTTVEVGVGVVKPLPTAAPSAPRLALTADEVLALLAVVGDPYAAPAAQASMSASASASAAAKAAAAADAERARRHPCRAADLVVTLGSRDGAGGSTFDWYAFRNTSGSACGLAGYPTLARGGTGALPFVVRYGVAQGPLSPTPTASPVLVEPGASVLSLVSSYRCDVGEAGAVPDLVVTVPGDPTPIALPESRQPVCVGGPAAPGNEIDVSAFYRPTA